MRIRPAAHSPAEVAIVGEGSVGRHLGAMLLGLALAYVFWLSRPQWDPEMRLWKAVGDASALLLFIALAIGPLARLFPASAPALGWRRELGVWCAVLAALHALLVLAGWARWDLLRFLGYEFIPEVGRWVRLEPGFGIANIMGVVALLWATILAATSTDRAVGLLGPSAWKWLHGGAYVLFYLTVLHAGYFLFLHYQFSFHREVPPPDWFRFPFLALGLAIPLLQGAAFVLTVRRRRIAGAGLARSGRARARS
jgi:methionine sulfoxide reductase heme-binding subunit